jgi:hypothetical protein
MLKQSGIKVNPLVYEYVKGYEIGMGAGVNVAKGWRSASEENTISIIPNLNFYVGPDSGGFGDDNGL